MTNKFPIGSQWKTRAGHWAVVVASSDKSILAWHAKGHPDQIHRLSGDHEYDRKYDLLTPWQEPRKGTVWVNIYDNGNVSVFLTKKSADCYDVTRIACISADWTEGDGL